MSVHALIGIGFAFGAGVALLLGSIWGSYHSVTKALDEI